MDYSIKKDKVVFERDGVYFATPTDQIDEFKYLVAVARIQVRRGLDSKQEVLDLLEEYSNI